MSYKVIYHVGNDLNLKTRVSSGTLTFEEGHICISGAKPLNIAFSKFRNVEMFRLHGLGRMIKVECADSTVFLTVVRLNLFGFVVIINFFKAAKLFEDLKKCLAQPSQMQPEPVRQEK